MDNNDSKTLQWQVCQRYDINSKERIVESATYNGIEILRCGEIYWCLFGKKWLSAQSLDLLQKKISNEE